MATLRYFQPEMQQKKRSWKIDRGYSDPDEKNGMMYKRTRKNTRKGEMAKSVPEAKVLDTT